MAQPKQNAHAKPPGRRGHELLAQVTLVNPEYANEPEEGHAAAQSAKAAGERVDEANLGRSAEIPSEASGLTEITRVRLIDLLEPTMYDEDRPGAVRVPAVDDATLANTLANAGADNLVPLAPLGAVSWAAIAGASAAGAIAGTAAGSSTGSPSSAASANARSSPAAANGNAANAQGTSPVSGDNQVNAREALDSTVIGGKTANAGSQVSVSIKQVQADGVSVIREVAVGDVVINPDGNWQLPASTVSGLADGLYSLTVLTVDLQGNRSESVQTFVVDKAPPAAPTVLAINTTLTDATPTISGSAATPGDKIQVVSPTGEVLGTTVAADGSWSVTPTIELAAGGPRSFVITASDLAGNTSSPTFLPVSVAVPASFSAALESSSNSASTGDVITNITTPTIAGIGKPGANIAVATSSGEILNTVVGADGGWSVTLTRPLSEGGPQKISVSSVQADGTTTSISVPIIIDTTAPSKITANIVSSSDSGKPGDAITNDNTPTIAGTDASPGDAIRVIAPTGETMQTVVGLDGRWSVTPTMPAPSVGDQIFTINVSDSAGNVGPTSSLLVHIDTNPPATPSAALDLAYANGSTIAGHTRSSTPTISGYDAVPGTTITVTSPAGEVMSAKPAADGSWCVTTQIELAAGGPHLFTVTATDLAGNISPATSVAVIVDSALTWQASPVLDFAVINNTLILSTDGHVNSANYSGNNSITSGDRTAGAVHAEVAASPPVVWSISTILLASLDSSNPVI